MPLRYARKFAHRTAALFCTALLLALGAGAAQAGNINANISAYASNMLKSSAKIYSEGDLVWVRDMGGSSSEEGYSVAVDVSGSVYTTGAFRGIVDFDPGPDVLNLTSAGYDDIFITKLDANGTLVWARAIGGKNTQYGTSIAVDASGNVYTTGAFWGIVDFDPGSDIFNLTPAGEFDVFVSKLDANGDFVWAKAMGGMSGYDIGTSIALDAAGNIYTTGWYSTGYYSTGTADFDPGVGVFNLTSAGLDDMFISKLDANGTFVWVQAMGGRQDIRGYSVAVDIWGDVYTTGFFGHTVDFDPGVGTFNLTAAEGSNNFVSKLDANGNFVWAKTMGGAGSCAGGSVVLDTSGNVYITGYFNGTIDFDPGAGIFNLISAGSDDIYVSKLDANGDLVWATSMGGIGPDYGASIALDAAENIYITGYFNSTALFGLFSLSAHGPYWPDIFVSKLDGNGNFVWVNAIGGYGHDSGYSLALNRVGDVYITGYFENTADFDPGAGIFNLTSAGSSDFFVLKLSGLGEGEPSTHSADQNMNNRLNLSELLRMIQYFYFESLHCDITSEDGYNPGVGDQTCMPHSADYNPQDWVINFAELLRVIQFFNIGAYYFCPGVGEDSFCPGLP